MWFEILLTTFGDLCIFGAGGRSVAVVLYGFDQSFLRQGSEKTKILSFIGEVDVVRQRARPRDHIFICVGHGCVGSSGCGLVLLIVVRVALRTHALKTARCSWEGSEISRHVLEPHRNTSPSKHLTYIPILTEHS